MPIITVGKNEKRIAAKKVMINPIQSAGLLLVNSGAITEISTHAGT